MIRAMGEWTELRKRIETFLAADPAREVTEEGELLFDLRRTEFRVEEAHDKLLLHLWSEERNWVRRVVGVAEETGDRLVLEVKRFGQKKPARLTIAPPSRRADIHRNRQTARRAYSRYLKRLLQREFPRAKVEAVSTAAGQKRSFSGLYTRARLSEGNRWWAVLGVNQTEDAATVDGLLTYALIWLDWNRERYPERVWVGLRLFLPAGAEQTTAQRLAFLDGNLVKVELFAVEEDEGACTAVDPQDFGNLQTRMAPASHAERVQQRESSSVERVRALAPEETEAIVLAGREELSLRFRGLDFARSYSGRVVFGVGDEEEDLSAVNFSRLAGLVKRLGRERIAEGNANSPFYRWRPEAWLEYEVLRAPGKVDPRLVTGKLYRQVILAGGSERGVADLLGVTREGRLVVLELKASVDIHLPLQGLDYWIRVHWHHRRGELAGAGYFSEVNLQPSPPELVLVAPALQFHPTSQAVVRYFSPEVRVSLVGLNEDWRRELHVVWRQSGREQG